MALPRHSYAGVLASMATSPSSQSELGLNSIQEDNEVDDE
jgi:hypothetical protein